MITNYLKELKSRLQGDEKGIIAAQNERKSMSAVNGNISSLEGLIVDQEEVLRDAEEAFNEAKYPVIKITDNSNYISSIKSAYQRVQEAKDTLQNTKDSLKFWKELKDDYSKQVSE